MKDRRPEFMTIFRAMTDANSSCEAPRRPGVRHAAGRDVIAFSIAFSMGVLAITLTVDLAYHMAVLADWSVGLAGNPTVPSRRHTDA